MKVNNMSNCEQKEKIEQQISVPQFRSLTRNLRQQNYF